jgi:hypothetical protein
MMSDPGKDVRLVIAAALGALWFALHPLQVEPVAWVSGLKDVLCGTFSLLSLLLFLMSGHDRANRMPLRFLGSLALMALAVLSKPSAVILPLLGYVLSLLITHPTKRVRWDGPSWNCCARRLAASPVRDVGSPAHAGGELCRASVGEAAGGSGRAGLLSL